MTDLRDAARQALELLKELQGGCTDSDDGTVEALTVWCPEVIENLEAALEQPEQATGKESLQVGQEEPEGGWQSAPSPQVTQRIADMPMSEYRRGVNDGFKLGLREGRIKAEDEMREQPEQEPVAWMVYTQDGKSVCVTDNPADFIEWRSFPLYTHPPRREWRGLTEEEIQSVIQLEREKRFQRRPPLPLSMTELSHAIEAKLKEKNHE
jgi:hypothetical protein